eukprot:365252-Chlamydomonas_euryale.AAC.4
MTAAAAVAAAAAAATAVRWRASLGCFRACLRVAQPAPCTVLSVPSVKQLIARVWHEIGRALDWDHWADLVATAARPAEETQRDARAPSGSRR